MRKLAMIALALWATTALGQQSRFTPVSETAVGNGFFANRFKPQSFKLFSLNDNALRADLAAAPSEKVVTARQSSTIISLPTPDGMQRFSVVDAPVMEAALAARYPGIHSYIAAGIDNPAATARISMSPQGFQGMISAPGMSTVYISQADAYYMVYARSAASNRTDRFNCLTKDEINPVSLTETAGSLLRNADDGNLRTYRLALCGSGEYSQSWLNGTETTDAQRKAKVLAAMNNAITRLNGIYERDFNVRLVLVANNDAVIYLNASTDPFTTVASWNTQTQTTCTNVIGAANYDVGHAITFVAAPGNGNAGCIGCVCLSNKGSGWSGYFDFASDFFVVDYLTHEVGHQFGGNHTHTYSGDEGFGTQMEPGSGSTIMGYAGITGATTDVQPHSDDYFHSVNIQQITNYVKSTNGNCATVTATGNAIPTANAGADYVIPRSTPFTLSGTGTDANAGDVLSYNWEQFDNRGTGFSTVPSATATAGPQFRSRPSLSNGSRTFPALASILDGTNTNKWEVLPSVARTLNFRFTVRDNRAGGGANRSDDMVLTINGTAGPFAVTSPNTAVSWAGNIVQNITWSVNSTNVAPVNCANVKISLSTDGGNTFSTLIASTPNDGSEAISIPNTPSTTCRIKIEAVGNIFFDISNVNFTITSGVACSAPIGLSSSGITASSATVSWNAVSGANSYDVDYKTTASSTWTNAATGTTSTSVGISGLTSGVTYDWRVRANCTGGSSNYQQAQFTTTGTACVAPAGLSSSSITTTSALVSWGAVGGVGAYLIDYKPAASATWIRAATANTSTSLSIAGLTAGTLYDWRVQSLCSGSSSAFAQAQFTTLAGGCATAFEPNESTAAAATISSGVANQAAITTATDNDYFRITTTATTNNTFSLVGPAGVDFDMTILNSAGTAIGSGTGSTATETVSLTNQPAGTYFIRIFGYNGALSASCYTITATANAVTGCASSLDNSTNGTAAGAATVPFNSNVTGLISPTGDVDFYRFVITTGGTATITLTTLPADYDLQLLSSNGTTQLAISQAGGTGSETISRTYTPGTYFVRVYGYNGANSATACYTLRVALGTASRDAELVSGSVNKQTVELFPNPAKNQVNVWVNGYTGRSTVQIFDLYGKQVMQQVVTDGQHALNISSLPQGVYMMRVNNKGTEVKAMKFVKE